MRFLDIKGADVFKLDKVMTNVDVDGKERLVCNYVKFYGPKNTFKVTFEGYCKGDEIRVRDEVVFSQLMRVYNDRRLYCQGVLFLDGQFENLDADKSVSEGGSESDNAE